MCSNYTISPRIKFKNRYQEISETRIPKSHAWPGYRVPVLRISKDDEPIFETRFWSFVARFPGKRDPSKMTEKLIQNAVSETVDKKPTFKKSWMNSQRCVLPGLRFFEPKEGKFTPIQDPEHEILHFAGIWNDDTKFKEETHKACTMLTTEPNQFMANFHDRMPVILDPKDIEEWLSLDTEPEQAIKLCKPWRGKLEFV